MRKKLGLTQEKLAFELGVHPRTVARWEGGRSQPHSIYLARLRDMLDAVVREDVDVGAQADSPVE